MRKLRARLSAINAYATERINGASEVRLFGQEERTLNEFDDIQNSYLKSSFKVVGWDAGLFAAVEALSALAMAGVLWWGGSEVIAGVATFGTLVAFIEYLQKFFSPLRDLSAKFSVLQTSNASLERIFDLLDRPEEKETAPCHGGLKGNLQLRKVDFSYDDKTPVLKGINFEINKGETVAIVGASGSGKSTLARLLLKFYPPSSGQITFGGRPLDSLSPTEVRRHIGWVSQEPFLFAGSLKENLDPRSERSEEELRKLLKQVGVLETVERLGGLNAPLLEKGKNLSAGQRQLLCLARALAHTPELIILDEATSRLDAHTEEMVSMGISKAHSKGSVILIAHRLRQARRASRILVMNQGMVCEEGSHEELMTKNGLYARLWKLQELGHPTTEPVEEAASL